MNYPSNPTMMQPLQPRLLLSLFLCLGIACSLSGQKTKVADQLYQNYGYKSSIPLYENKTVIDQEDMTKIANAYRLNHDTENAEFWYGQIVRKSKDPQHTLYYAQALQSNGKLEQAKIHYLKYDEMLGGDAASNDQRGRLLAAAIDRMNEFRHTAIQIKNESLINTDKLDFSPAYYKNGIIFVSTRPASGEENNERDLWINDHFMSLFYASINESGDLEKVEDFSLDLNTRYHEGPVCFTKNGERIYFTRNHFNNNKRVNNKDGVMRLQIYTAHKEGDRWSSPVEMPFNTIEYEEAHPTLSPDGNKLYFASDRKGGYGGMDLYVVERKNGQWTKAQNLGKNVNTPGNEVFPYLHDDGTLYFASNGWGGLGGLDIFSSIERDSVWQQPNNIGTPFNSKKDDFGFILNVLKTEGYLTSARAKGLGQDDIYSFKMPQNFPSQVNICAYEEGTQQRLSDVQLEISEYRNDGSMANLDDSDLSMILESTDQEDEYLLKFKKQGLLPQDKATRQLYNTDAEGRIKTTLKSDKHYRIIARKNGYQIAEEIFDGHQLEGISNYQFCIPLKKMNCMHLDGWVKNKKYGNLIPGATVTMTNLCTGEDIVLTADRDGAFNFPCIDCGCEYLFRGQKMNFMDAASKENTIGDNCQLGATLSTVILLTPDDERFAALLDNNELTVGAVIELKNIFYDFDQFYIRDDAKEDLDNVVRLMQQYPSLVVELASHTDARGTDTYNETLSQNRANAAVEYIISRGIQRNRLVAMGYGERHLRNNCINFSDCNEAEHQRNRRTEIKVLAFDRKDIEVNHLDNLPKKVDPANPLRRFIWD